MNIYSVIPDRITIPAKLFLSGTIFSGLADGILSVVLQLYIKSLGYESTAIGSIFTMTFISAMIMTIPMGVISNRYGKRITFLFGFTLGSISIPLIVFIPRTEFLFASFAMLGISTATNVILNPFYSNFFDNDNMDKAFSLLLSSNIIAYSMGNLFGYIPPVLISRLGFSLQNSYRIVIMIAAIFLFLKLLFLFMSTIGSEVKIRRNKFKFKIESRTILAKLCLIFLIGKIGASIFNNLFPYYVNTKFGIQSDALGTLFFMSNIGVGVSQILSSKFSKKMGTLKAICMGFGSCVPFYTLMAFSPNFRWLSIFWIIRRIISNMASPLVNSLTMKLLNENERVSVYSTSSMASNVGSALGTFMGGYLMENLSLDMPIYLGAGFYGLFAVLFYILFRNEVEKRDY